MPFPKTTKNYIPKHDQKMTKQRQENEEPNKKKIWNDQKTTKNDQTNTKNDENITQE
jgi:hypothetical protein